eukprot:TRINITY_DN70754_c0_g1_i1.p1 TRINITY_DN70754_c0_g1~~TRINITY_DN70754_c0_g1_i1.p1  ORF type:complete len:417 (+),score=69.60 TRINITY_DN70754_c0_g1_i1:65-1252(+)
MPRRKPKFELLCCESSTSLSTPAATALGATGREQPARPTSPRASARRVRSLLSAAGTSQPAPTVTPTTPRRRQRPDEAALRRRLSFASQLTASLAAPAAQRRNTAKPQQSNAPSGESSAGSGRPRPQCGQVSVAASAGEDTALRAGIVSVSQRRVGGLRSPTDNSGMWGLTMRRTHTGWGWKLPRHLLTRALRYVYCVRDLRAVALTSRSWRAALGPPNGLLGLRAANPWQPYQGCWWVPLSQSSALIVQLHTEFIAGARGSGCLLTKSAGDDEYHVDVASRLVTVHLTTERLEISWWAPQRSAAGKRTQAEVSCGAFDALLVAEIGFTIKPLPGKQIPRQLYSTRQGGSLWPLRDCHLRRPRAKLAWHDLSKAIDDVRAWLQRQRAAPAQAGLQ